MDYDKARNIGMLALRLAGLALVVGGVLVVGVLGWQWQANVPVDRVDVTGAVHAHPDSLRALARVDSGMVMSEVQTALVADRVTRHPWVRSVDVRERRSSRILDLVVTERVPAALVMQDSRPAFYLDAGGYAMPMPDSSAFDVPLVRDLDAEYHPITSVAPPALTRLLGVLQNHPEQALVAEIAVRSDGALQLYTEPAGEQPSVLVEVGRDRFARSLDRLGAFYRQVLRPGSPTPIRRVDLRFDGQIITQAS